MKSKLTYLFVLIVVAVLYNGCGSDTVTGGNGPGNPTYTLGDLLGSKDSLTSDGDTATLGVLPALTGTDQGYRVNYEVSCNTDSALFSLMFSNGTFDTIYYSKLHTTIAGSNGTFEQLVDARSWGSNRLFSTGLIDYGHTTGQQITVKNFKIYRITYN